MRLKRKMGVLRFGCSETDQGEKREAPRVTKSELLYGKRKRIQTRKSCGGGGDHHHREERRIFLEQHERVAQAGKPLILEGMCEPRAVISLQVNRKSSVLLEDFINFL